jgi:hypothetical protein
VRWAFDFKLSNFDLGARERIRVATYHSDLPLSIARSPVALNTTHVLTFDRMYEASEDVTGALHAATRRLRLEYRSTALESPVVILSSPSRSLWDISHWTMHSETDAQQSQAPVFMCYLSTNQININTSNNLPRPPSVKHQHLFSFILPSTRLFALFRR